MKTRQLGDITIDRILELEGPYARPLEFFDEALPEAVEPHRHWLEPRALDPETGKIILSVQSYLLRTRHHTILIDTCIGCRKSYESIPEWNDLRDEIWLRNLAAAGVGPEPSISSSAPICMRIIAAGTRAWWMAAGRRPSPTPNISSRRTNTRPARRTAPPSSTRTCCPSWKPGKRLWSIPTTPSTTRSG